MAKQSELETLFVTFKGRDDQLEETFQRVKAKAGETAKAIRASIADAFTGKLFDPSELNAAFDGVASAAAKAASAVKVVTDAQAGQVDAAKAAATEVGRAVADSAQEATRGAEAAAAATGKMADAAKVAAQESREVADATAKAAASDQHFADTVDWLHNRLREMETSIEDQTTALDKLGTVQLKVARTGEEFTVTQEQLGYTIKDLSDQVASQRNLWAARVSSDATFTKSTRELRQALLDLVDTGVLTEAQMKKVTQAAAYAQRGLDSASGVASRGGLAWTMQIALTNQFGQALRGLGPAGAVAANGLGFFQTGLGNLQKPLTGADFTLGKLGKSLLRFPGLVSLATAAVTLGLGVALYKAAEAASDTADKIDKAAKSAGFTAQAFQEVAFALEQSRVSVDETQKGLAAFNQRLGQAAGGTQAIADAYKRLGVDIRDTNGAIRNSENVFDDVIDALAKYRSAADQAALGGQILGKDFARIILPALKDGKEGFDALRKQARDLGLILSGDTVQSLVQFKGAMDTVKKQIETAKIEIAAGFLPVLQQELVPFLQNAVVPALQNVATRVQEFSKRFLDQGPAGQAFRADIVASLDLLITFGKGVVAAAAAVVGAVQSILSVGASIGGFIGGVTASGIDRQTREGLQEQITLLEGILKREDLTLEKRELFNRQLAETKALLNSMPQNWFQSGTQAGAAAGANFADGALASFNLAMDALTADVAGGLENWLANAASAAGSAASSFADLADVITDVNTAATTLAGDGAPEGSLAHAEAAARLAAQAFSLAVDDKSRAAAKAVQTYWEQVAEAIRKAFADKDPLEAARTWTGRLTAEMRQGVKNAMDVVPLIEAGIANVKAAAAQAFADFGWDSNEYRETITKLDFLESYLDELKRGITIPVAADTSKAEAALKASLETLQTRYSGDAGLLYTLQAVERTRGRFTTLQEAFRGLAEAGVMITGPMLEFLQRRFQDTATAAEEATTAVQRLWDAERARQASITENRFAGDAGILYTLQVVEQSEGRFESLRDAFRKLQAAGVTMSDGMLRVLAERFKEAEVAAEDFGKTIQSLDVSRAMEALNARFSGANAIQATFQAVEQTAGSFTSVGDALRKLAAAGVVTTGPMLEALTKRFESAGEAAETAAEAIARIRADDLPQQLTVATIAAAAFGDQTAVTAAQLGAYESAIKRILELDPAADVSDLIATWTVLNGVLTDQQATADRTREAQAGLAAAIRQVAELTGTAPSKFDEMRAALDAAGEQGLITKDQLEDLLRTIGKLEKVDAATKALNDLAGNIDLGTGIARGLTDALAGVRDGDLQGALGGLTQLGTAIGTLIGGPAVGALVQAIGQGLQAVVGLFQVISDLFTGDSPARRKLAESLSSTVAGAFKTGIIEGLRGGEDWRENLRQNVQEAVLGAVVDAFIQAAVMQAIFAPFIDQFTKLLKNQGADAAFAFFDQQFGSFWESAMSVVEDFVERGQGYFKQAERAANDVQELTPGRFDLPSATVSVLAAPQWSIEMGTVATTMREAGDAMLSAANMMQATFQQGIPVTTQSSRGIDAMRSL